jgi:hypothetical protein
MKIGPFQVSPPCVQNKKRCQLVSLRHEMSRHCQLQNFPHNTSRLYSGVIIRYFHVPTETLGKLRRAIRSIVQFLLEHAFQKQDFYCLYSPLAFKK